MFKPGDKVICIDKMNSVFLVIGKIYTISRVPHADAVLIKELGFFYKSCMFEKVEAYPTLRSDYV